MTTERHTMGIPQPDELRHTITELIRTAKEERERDRQEHKRDIHELREEISQAHQSAMDAVKDSIEGVYKKIDNIVTSQQQSQALDKHLWIKISAAIAPFVLMSAGLVHLSIQGASVPLAVRQNSLDERIIELRDDAQTLEFYQKKHIAEMASHLAYIQSNRTLLTLFSKEHNWNLKQEGPLKLFEK